MALGLVDAKEAPVTVHLVLNPWKRASLKAAILPRAATDCVPVRSRAHEAQPEGK